MSCAFALPARADRHKLMFLVSGTCLCLPVFMSFLAEGRKMASVPGRFFDVIDDYDLAGPFDRHEFQPQLLLQCGEQ